jgi:hypothetical protein
LSHHKRLPMKKLVFIAILLIPLSSYADCMLASNGQVYCGAGRCQINNAGAVSCSNYFDGGAEVNSLGRVVCGRGLCVKGRSGSVYCSIEEDGGAATNQGGQVKCYGGCEPASESMCESLQGL